MNRQLRRKYLPPFTPGKYICVDDFCPVMLTTKKITISRLIGATVHPHRKWIFWCYLSVRKHFYHEFYNRWKRYSNGCATAPIICEVCLPGNLIPTVTDFDRCKIAAAKEGWSIGQRTVGRLPDGNLEFSSWVSKIMNDTSVSHRIDFPQKVSVDASRNVCSCRSIAALQGWRKIQSQSYPPSSTRTKLSDSIYRTVRPATYSLLASSLAWYIHASLCL